MAENDTSAVPDSNASTPESNAGASINKAPKDRKCPFCGQAFTSSSLGRHLDLYIRPKNPKPPDGVHEVEEIRKIRGGITRRQAKNGKGGTGAAAPNDSRRDSSVNGRAKPLAGNSPVISPANMRDDAKMPATTYFNHANWQATGVINNLPPRAPSRGTADVPPPPRAATGQAQRAQEMRRDAAGNRIQRPEYDSESMTQLQEAAELGRAAEMALREVLGSLAAARTRSRESTLFEDFDFFSLSFPALCLAILPAPSTIFSGTPFPGADTWTIAPPGKQQFEAMNRYLNERVLARQRTNTSVSDTVVFKHHSHLGAAFENWQSLGETQCVIEWNLEILRSFARAKETTARLRSDLETAQQHSRHLEAQYDRLSRCQLPREFLMHPPNTIPVPPSVDRHFDPTKLKTGVAEVQYDPDALIAKWKAQIKATYRPPRTTWSSSHPQAPTYAETGHNALRDDMFMNGSVFGINGPMPRRGNSHAGTGSHHSNHAHSNVSYETPPHPGVVVGAEDDEATVEDGVEEDAEGEAEDEEGSEAHAAIGPLVRKQYGPMYGCAINGMLNGNGKRPSTHEGMNGRTGTKIYRAQTGTGDGL